MNPQVLKKVVVCPLLPSLQALDNLHPVSRLPFGGSIRRKWSAAAEGAVCLESFQSGFGHEYIIETILITLDLLVSSE